MNTNELNKLTSDVGEGSGKLSEAQVAAWLQEVDARKKAEKEWRAEAGKISALYEGYKRDHSPFNILYSNTETLAPALYNNTPRPAAGRRYKDKDPLGLAVANTLNRTLSFLMDSNDMDEPTFDKMAEHAILQALVPGRGAVRFKYVADYEEDAGLKALLALKPKDVPNTPSEGEAIQENEAEEGEVPPKVTNERVCGELVEWDRFCMGYAKHWYQVPWVAFEHHMVESEVKENFPGFENKIKYSELEKDEQNSGGPDCQRDKRKVAVIQEIWDKTTRTVIFLSPGYKHGELKLTEDPLGISGFFPMEEPLSFLAKVSGMIPQPIYNLYREQAEELNLITRRITAVMSALKVRGVYPSELDEMSKLLNADDNTLIAIENVQAYEGRALKDLIMMLPLSELVSVLQQLYVQRTNIKQVIYEITGISDILRGSSVASETATAQNIKNQWGTLRLKKAQKKVSVWCKNSLRIIAEIAGNKFSESTFMRMTELPYLTQQQEQQVQTGMQQWQAEQAAQPAPQPQPGQPPAPPPQPPQQLVDAMATPKWSKIISLLRDSIGTEYRIDIETNSTIADDLAEDQKNIGDLLNSLSQFLNGVAPLIENGTMPFEVAKSMMLGMVRKMAMGPEVEDALDKMQPPKPPEAEGPSPPPPEDPNIKLKAEADAARIQAQMESDKQTAEIQRQTFEQTMAQSRMEMQLKQAEFDMKMEELNQKKQANAAKFEQQMALAKQRPAKPSGGGNAAV